MQVTPLFVFTRRIELRTPSPNGPTSVSVTLALDGPTVARADELARQARLSRSALIRCLIESTTSVTPAVAIAKRRFKAEGVAA